MPYQPDYDYYADWQDRNYYKHDEPDFISSWVMPLDNTWLDHDQEYHDWLDDLADDDDAEWQGVPF